MGNKERIMSALLLGAITLSGCKPVDSGNQTPLPSISMPRPTDSITLKPVEQAKESLKREILGFSWKDAEDSGKLKKFVDDLADSYLQLTQTPRLDKEGLTQKTYSYSSEQEFINAVRKIDPSYAIPHERGYADYKNKNVFLNLEALRRDGPDRAGLEIINTLWHEWGHLDITERTTGELLNNQKFFFYSPNSNSNELFRKYIGAAIYTNTYYGFKRFEEVLNEIMVLRRMTGQLELGDVVSSKEFYQNGTDFFSKFTSIYIPLKTLYEMHATSDFEGLAKLVGQYLPGKETPITRGVRLFRGIHQSDSDLIKQTGVFEQIPK